MRNLTTQDLQIGLKAKKFICVNTREAYAYDKNGKRTQVRNGYYVDALSPELDGVVLTVKVKELKDVKKFKPVFFGGLDISLYAPGSWDIRVSLKADIATGEKEGAA
jgi:hypothetical protein